MASERTVRIDLTPDAPAYEGQLILFMLINQLIRLGDFAPRLLVSVPATARHRLLRLLPDGPLPEVIEEYVRPFPHRDRLSLIGARPSRVSDFTIRLSPEPAGPGMNLWGQGWMAFINAASKDEPAGPPNPIGPCVASAFGAAELFKFLIRDLPLRPGLKAITIDDLVFSAFDYSLGEGINPIIPEAIDVDGAVVVGLGGIGAAMTAAMASVEALVGTVNLVDRDEMDVTTHNRHLITRPDDLGYKVDLAARALSFHDGIQPHRLWFDEFVRERGDAHRLVVVGVDSDHVRREIQSTLPEVVLNGGTSDDASLRVTRHNYRDGACLSCISRDDLREHPAERQLAGQLGLALETVLAYIASGDAVPAEVLRLGGVLTEEQVEVLADKPMPEIQVRVCSELQLTGGVDQPAVSISFLSAMPGFLLLGEMIKEKHFSRQRPPLNDAANHAFLSMLGRPHPALVRGRMQKRPDCDCARVPFVNAYQRKWGKR